MKNALIACLLLAVLLLTYRLAEVENQRYALIVGMCPSKDSVTNLPNLDCLAKVQTRTHMLWHVFYALKG
jgi:hypothetical protein